MRPLADELAQRSKMIQLNHLIENGHRLGSGEEQRIERVKRDKGRETKEGEQCGQRPDKMTKRSF